MSLRAFITVCVLSGVCAGLVPGCAHAPEPRALRIEQLVDAQLLSEAFAQPLPLEVSFRREGKSQFAIGEYRFTRTSADQHYVLTVALAPAGEFLDAERYARDLADPSLSVGTLEASFPDIGLRARREIYGFGPGGASFGLTFTTRDGRWDIRVMESNLLPDGVDVPDLDAEALAQRLSARYDAAMRDGRKTNTRD